MLDAIPGTRLNVPRPMTLELSIVGPGAVRASLNAAVATPANAWLLALGAMVAASLAALQSGRAITDTPNPKTLSPKPEIPAKLPEPRDLNQGKSSGSGCPVH